MKLEEALKRNLPGRSSEISAEALGMPASETVAPCVCNDCTLPLGMPIAATSSSRAGIVEKRTGGVSCARWAHGETNPGQLRQPVALLKSSEASIRRGSERFNVASLQL